MRMSRHLGVYHRGDRQLYLYKNGTENTDITGGLTAYAYVPSTSSSSVLAPTVSKGSSSTTLTLTSSEANGGSYFTKDTINLSRYKTLNIKATALEKVDGGYVRFGATSTRANKFVVAAVQSITSTGTVSVDISELSGSFYIFLTLYGNGNKKVTYTDWWLE